jgi:hypothetical protein
MTIQKTRKLFYIVDEYRQFVSMRAVVNQTEQQHSIRME